MKMLAFAFFLAAVLTACSGPLPNGPGHTEAPDSGAPASQGGLAADGGWESSGGDGVACFANADQAQTARNDLKSKGYLSAASRAQIQSVTVLDSWDFLSEDSKAGILFLKDYTAAGSFRLEPSLKSATDPDQAVTKVLENIAKYTPLFAQRLKMVGRRAPVSSWKASTEVASVEDSRPARELDAACVLIQLANRRTVSVEGKLPEVQIAYDQELVEKFLSATERAMLTLHEHLYLIAKEGTHENSDEVRKILAFFFSAQAFAFGEGQDPFVQRVTAFRSILGYPFGDYMRFFIGEAELNQSVEGLNGHSRYLSLISLMLRLRDANATCQSDGGGQAACSASVIEKNPEVWKDLSEEEAFLFVARFHIDSTLYAVNSEYLSLWDEADPAAVSEAQRKEGVTICELIADNPAPWDKSLNQKSLAYCEKAFGVKAAVPNARDFNCNSPEIVNLQMAATDTAANLSLIFEFNPETGAATRVAKLTSAAEFKSSKLVQELSKSAVQRDFIALEVYRLSALTAPERLALREILQRETKSVKAVRLQSGSADVTIEADIAALAKTEIEISALEIELDCQVKERL